MSCSVVKRVWQLTSIGELSGLVSNFIQWWNMIAITVKLDDLAVVAMTQWMLWRSRNKLIWQGKSLSEVVRQALCMLAQWRSTNMGIDGMGGM